MIKSLSTTEKKVPGSILGREKRTTKTNWIDEIRRMRGKMGFMKESWGEYNRINLNGSRKT